MSCNCFHRFLAHTKSSWKGIETSWWSEKIHRFSDYITRLYLCFEVLLSAMITLHVLDHTNKAFEESLQKSPGPHEMQINLWYPRCILLRGKDICSACLHFFRTVKGNATSFDAGKLPQNGILRTELERHFPHFAWSALWQKKMTWDF